MTHNRVMCCSILTVVVLTGAPVILTAQAKGDSTRLSRRDTLESVVVRATRASGGGTTGASHTATRSEILRSTTGQDASMALRTTPSMTAYSEAGAWTGYSYLRLRGLDQSRLNITVDGVPLNDPEDQVLYFSNVPDFLGSISSVNVGRGVGASTFGTAAFAGSLNFQSMPLATTPRFGQAEVAGGSFRTWRTSVQGATGVSPNGLAAYGRFSRQGTDGYRDHSGNDAWSAFGSAGWFGERDALKVTGFAGLSGMRLAYLAAPESELLVNRRTNPLTESEGDRFHQEMVSLQYSRAIRDGFNGTLMLYRNSAAGAYDVNFGPGADPAVLSFGNFALAHVWHGATLAVNWTAADWALSLGGTASDYHRDHALAIRPDLDTREYTNTGVKREAAAFLKATWSRGALRAGGDLQVRTARFRYAPSVNAGIAPQPATWRFVNPKFGVTWDATSHLSYFATAGRTWREPTRGDLLAGADDLNRDNVNSLIPFSQVKSEKVDDYEAGATWRGDQAAVTANLFAMEFHNEIAPIGALALTGAPLRKSVPRSYRRGVELDGTTRFRRAGSLSGNVAWMHARIAAYTDEAAARTFRDIEPIMSPPLTANIRWESPTERHSGMAVAVRFVDRMHLANDGNDALVVPASTVMDLTFRADRGAFGAQVEVNNVLEANAYAAGYTDGSARYLFPIASRALLLTLRWRTD